MILNLIIVSNQFNKLSNSAKVLLTDVFFVEKVEDKHNEDYSSLN